MQQQEIEKIKNLVKISSLLTSSEKEEWLVLVEIMNDKQLLELRRILETVSQESIVNSQESIVKSKEPKTAEIPSLTHIMNLPKVGAVFPGSRSQKSEVRSQRSGIGSQELVVGDQKTGFWKRIKDVLAEKELPPGHAEAVKELELPASTSASLGRPALGPLRPPDNVQSRESGSINYESGKTKAAHHPLSVSLPPTIPKPPLKPTAAPSAVKPEISKPAESMIKKFPRPAFSEEKLFVPGLKDTKVLMDAKLAKPKVPSSMTTPSSQQVGNLPLLYPTSREASSSAKASEDRSSDFRKEGMKQGGLTGIANLEQVSSLGPKDISKDLSSSLKYLAANVGYHKLLQALEKSPLFAAYINTGLAALLGQRDLEETGGDYLNRQEFEGFVDTLRAIKV